MGTWRSVKKHLNFYRLHLLFFTFIPLIFSIVLYASNGQHKISYIDCLFLCITSMTVCGLATVDLSQLTGWQQAIMFILMCIGSPVAVAWFIVYLRRYYFAKKFEHIIEAAAAKRSPGVLPIVTVGWTRKVIKFLKGGKASRQSSIEDAASDESGSSEPKGTSALKRVRTDMIRRMDDAPKLVNPSGWISDASPSFSKRPAHLASEHARHSSVSNQSINITRADLPQGIIRSNAPPIISADPSQQSGRSRRLSDPGQPSRPPSLISAPLHKYDTVAAETESPTYPRHATVEFAPRPRPRLHVSEEFVRTDTRRSFRPPGAALTQHMTNRTGNTAPPMSVHTNRSNIPNSRSVKYSGFGGFWTPFDVIKHGFKKIAPGVSRRLSRTLTVPRTTTIASHSGRVPTGVKPVKYISFEATVGRNSTFADLTDEQLEELGGVEYRALNALLWIVGGYHLTIQILSFVIIAPYISRPRWAETLTTPSLIKPVPSPWYALFQTVSAYTNTGTSLVDQSMVPFQEAYPMILVMMFLIVAGNTGFPIFLRLTIWLLTKMVPEQSRANETLHFLLDHPRRCFIYLFPSHQTWFLLTIVVLLNFTDFFFFMILDIGDAIISQIPIGTRILAGLMQAIAVRAAGFAIVPLAAVAPAVKMLYVIMMYISVYPIAMSVRSTNVYEEQSLGVFGQNEEEDDGESRFVTQGSRVTVWSRYLAMHARRQLAFDMWWIVLALFLVCIIERTEIENRDSDHWFNIFTVVFELVSAYGTVGLSLGLPTANYSLSGAFRPLSKLIICLVMIRGRHRGLPVAIDRAVLLPSEFGAIKENNGCEQTYRNSEAMTRDPSSFVDQGDGSETYMRHRSGTLRRTDDDFVLHEQPEP